MQSRGNTSYFCLLLFLENTLKLHTNLASQPWASALEDGDIFIHIREQGVEYCRAVCLLRFWYVLGGEDSFPKTQFLYKIQEAYTSGEITSSTKAFADGAEFYHAELRSVVYVLFTYF